MAFLFAFSVSSGVGARDEIYPDKAVDVHVHLAALPDGKNGCILSPRQLKSFPFRFMIWQLRLPVDKPEQANKDFVDMLVSQLRESRYVKQAVILGLDGIYKADGSLDLNQTDFLIANEYVLEVARRNPGVLLPGVSINPQRRDAIEELERCIEAGAVLVKVLPVAQRFDLADPVYIPFYKAMAKARIPLLCHVGYEFTLAGYDQLQGNPAKLRLALDQGVAVIAAHGMSQGFFLPGPHWKTMVEFVRQYPNFCWDASALSLPNRVTMLLKIRRHPELCSRMKFGTDYPLPSYAYPALLAGQFRAYLELRRIKNPFDRHWRLLQILGLKMETKNE